jgi:hypothetical protein
MLGALIGGILGSHAASKAAETQANAAKDANAMQERMYNQQRTDQQPFRDAGISALSQLGNADFQRDFQASDFQKDPGYDFRMQEGQKALERSAAARGGIGSGGSLKALSRYGQDYASNEYNNAYNRFNADRDRRFGRLSSIAGVGQGATNQMGAASGNYANQYGANTIGAGDAQAAGIIGKANAWTGAINNVQKEGMDAVTMGMSGGTGGQDWMGRSLSSLGKG